MYHGKGLCERVGTNLTGNPKTFSLMTFLLSFDSCEIPWLELDCNPSQGGKSHGIGEG